MWALKSLQGLLHRDPVCSYSQTNIKEIGSLDNLIVWVPQRRKPLTLLFDSTCTPSSLSLLNLSSGGCSIKVHACGVFLAPVMWVSVIPSIWKTSFAACSMWKFVCVKRSAAKRLAGTCVIVVSHAARTGQMLESLQSEFVAAAVKWAERIWTEQMKEAVGTVAKHGCEQRRSATQQIAHTQVLCVYLCFCGAVLDRWQPVAPV